MFDLQVLSFNMRVYRGVVSAEYRLYKHIPDTISASIRGSRHRATFFYLFQLVPVN